jgi:hypothetical protein
MRHSAPTIHNARSMFRLGPAAIGVGLAILMAAVLWPGVPAVTAMALVTLGATTATIARFRGSASMSPILLMHLLVYGGLYSLFVGAALDVTTQQRPTRLSGLMLIDLILSAFPVAIALRLAWCEFCIRSSVN